MEYECITKFRDKNNRIKGYRLRDKNGMTVEVSAEKVKKAIERGDATISNLTLTSDGRLVDTGTKSIFKNVDEATSFIVKAAGKISRAVGWAGNLSTKDISGDDTVTLCFEPKNGNFVYKKENVYVELNIAWRKDTNKLSVCLMHSDARLDIYEEKSIDAVNREQTQQFINDYASYINGRLVPQI